METWREYEEREAEDSRREKRLERTQAPYRPWILDQISIERRIQARIFRTMLKDFRCEQTEKIERLDGIEQSEGLGVAVTIRVGRENLKYRIMIEKVREGSG